jgi:hypothetical protein
MAKDLAGARKELEEEFAKFRKHLGEIEQAWEAVERADADADLVSLLSHLEDVTKKVRTGGVLGSGANSHARARSEYLTLKGQAPK